MPFYRRPPEVELNAGGFELAVADVEAVRVAQDHVRAALGIDGGRIVERSAERLDTATAADLVGRHVLALQIRDALSALQSIEFRRLRRSEAVCRQAI